MGDPGVDSTGLFFENLPRGYVLWGPRRSFFDTSGLGIDHGVLLGFSKTT